MKTQGFTLIELLAVIVILAIIALIATPIVLGIIEDTKESAQLRSAEMYLDGVENAVMRENMNSGGNFRPTICEIEEGSISCDGKEPIQVEVDGEVPKEGTIIFEEGKIKEVTLSYESGTIVKDSGGNLVYSDAESEYKSICTLASDSTVAAGEYGAKYNCKVDPNKPEYTFYLLDNNDDGTSDLIMSHNITSSGDIDDGNISHNVVRWGGDVITDDVNPFDAYSTQYGPTTSMEELYNATKSWTNVEPLNYEYYDTDLQVVPNDYTGYKSYISIKGILSITASVDDVVKIIGTEEEPVRARMPMYSLDESVTEIPSTKTENNAFIFNNTSYNNNTFESGKYNLNGYWTLKSNPQTGEEKLLQEAYYVGNNGVEIQINAMSHDTDFLVGVRPIINVRL